MWGFDLGTILVKIFRLLLIFHFYLLLNECAYNLLAANVQYLRLSGCSEY